jgi:hypothetical protein
MQFTGDCVILVKLDEEGCIRSTELCFCVSRLLVSDDVLLRAQFPTFRTRVLSPSGPSIPASGTP